MTAPLLPGDVDAQGRPLMLGVMGGGQLGRMFVHAAQALGFQTAVLDPDRHSPAGRVSHLHVQAPYLATDALEQMQDRCAALTTEFENVPAQALRHLARTRPVAPSGDAVAVCQHRALEKAHFVRSGVPCAPHVRLEQEADLAAIGDDLFPAILKTSTLGYDGKGQVRLQSRSELVSAWDALQRVPCLLEKRVDLALELSVIVARDAQGAMVNLPVQQNLHHDGILAVTLVPAPDVSPALAEQAIANARAVAQSLDYVGVLCVEFFVLKDGTLVANEMAPRPHNSGHYSIDACDHSQFDLQVRTMAGLPLVQPRLHSPAVMLNLLGDLWYPSPDSDATRTPPWAQVLALQGVHLHLYGKSEPRRARKMGHLTVTAASMDEALKVASQAARLLGLPAPV